MQSSLIVYMYCKIRKHKLSALTAATQTQSVKSRIIVWQISWCVHVINGDIQMEGQVQQRPLGTGTDRYVTSINITARVKTNSRQLRGNQDN